MLSHKNLRSLVNESLSPFGLRLGLRPQEHKIEVLKEFEDVIVGYPYTMISETLQRLFFYLSAIIPNEESVLVFEEPESHAFPYYTKYLAELIALDENDNQYFISTHNPYFLLPIIEKSPKEELAVFLTYFRDYETKVKLLSESEVCKRISGLRDCKAVVDEDPGSIQPPYLARIGRPNELTESDLTVFDDTPRNNRIVVLRSKLEEWVLRAATEAGLSMATYGLPGDAGALHGVINLDLRKFERLIADLLEARADRVNTLRRLLT